LPQVVKLISLIKASLAEVQLQMVKVLEEVPIMVVEEVMAVMEVEVDLQAVQLMVLS